MYGHKWVDVATPSEENKNGTSEPEVKGKTDEKKEETSKPPFSFGATSYGFSLMCDRGALLTGLTLRGTYTLEINVNP